MKRHTESGFSVAEVLVLLFVAAVVLMIGAWGYTRIKTAKKLESVTNHAALDDTRPTLKNLGGVYLAAYNKNTGLAGDIKFDVRLVDPTRNIETQVYLFGQKISRKDQQYAVNPSFDFRGLNTQIDVIAAIDGKVVSVKTQPDNTGSEVVLAKSDSSTWHISYDHIVDLKVKRGDMVVAGQVLGRAAPYRGGTFYYELYIARKDAPLGDALEYVCPTTLLDSDVRPAYLEGLNLMVRDWGTFRTQDPYGPQDGGCVSSVVKAHEVDSK